jgi:hypothetical protein
MSACLSRRKLRGEQAQEHVDDLRIQLRTEQTIRVAGFRTDSADHPQVFVFGLPHGLGRDPVRAHTAIGVACWAKRDSS